MRRGASFLLLAVVAAILSTTGPAYGEECAGSAVAATTETRHFKCYQPAEALKWTLNIICMDACGQPWTSLAPQTAAVDGSCHLDSGTFCTPPYQRKDYTKGLYAETSAFPTRHSIVEGKVECHNRSQVVTLGNCPCAPACATASPGGEECLWSEHENPSCCETTCTPILLDLGGAGFELSGTEPPVAFDIDADGVRDAISWTRQGGDEAFLALDRNGNGLIDSGSELFGAATEQPASDDPNGFLALAVFDALAAGGNGDGRITVDDAVFSRLVLWNDADRDGTSSPSELTSLGDHGVAELSIEHVVSERRDRFGNRFRWTGHARTAEARPVTASDVVFVSAPD